MKTKTIKVFEYSELSAEAKERALHDWNKDSFDEQNGQCDTCERKAQNK